MQTYSALVFLALLLFPLVKSSVHELDHLSELHCDLQEKHYCAIEHNCQLCDFVFAASLYPPPVDSKIVFSQAPREIVPVAPELFLPDQNKYTFSLRGPPVS